VIVLAQWDMGKMRGAGMTTGKMRGKVQLTCSVMTVSYGRSISAVR